MLDVNAKLAGDLRLVFNFGICGVIVEGAECFDLNLQNVPLARVNDYKYLGVSIAENDMEYRKCAERVTMRVTLGT